MITPRSVEFDGVNAVQGLQGGGVIGIVDVGLISPVAVGNGGTGALNAAGARNNLFSFLTDGIGDLYFRQTTGAIGRLGIGTTGQVLQVSAGGLPTWGAGGGLGTPVSLSDGGTGVSVTSNGALLGALGAVPTSGGTMTGNLIINHNTATLPPATGPGDPPFRIGGADGQAVVPEIDAFGSSTLLHVRRANGTFGASPSLTALADQDQIFAIVAHGYDGAAYTAGRAAIAIHAAQTWNTTDQGTFIRFQTTALGQNTQAPRMVIRTGIVVGNPTGDDKGPGTLNVERLFLNNTEVTPTGTGLPTDGGTISGTPGTLLINSAADQLPLTVKTNNGVACYITFDNTPASSGAGPWRIGPGIGGQLQFRDEAAAPSPASRLTIDNAGLVHVLQNFQVDVNSTFLGNIVVHGDAELTVVPPSDRRLKDHIQPFTRGLEAVCQLNPITFEYNGLAGTWADGRTRVGLDADDTSQVIPEMVQTRARRFDIDGIPTKAIIPDHLTYALINAVKELANRLEALESRH